MQFVVLKVLGLGRFLLWSVVSRLVVLSSEAETTES